MSFSDKVSDSELAKNCKSATVDGVELEPIWARWPTKSEMSEGMAKEKDTNYYDTFIRWSWKRQADSDLGCPRLARLRGQDFATGKNFSFNRCHTKKFCVFFRETYFIKAIENFFSYVCIA